MAGLTLKHRRYKNNTEELHVFHSCGRMSKGRDCCSKDAIGDSMKGKVKNYRLCILWRKQACEVGSPPTVLLFSSTSGFWISPQTLHVHASARKLVSARLVQAPAME